MAVLGRLLPFQLLSPKRGPGRFTFLLLGSVPEYEKIGALSLIAVFEMGIACCNSYFFRMYAMACIVSGPAYGEGAPHLVRTSSTGTKHDHRLEPPLVQPRSDEDPTRHHQTNELRSPATGSRDLDISDHGEFISSDIRVGVGTRWAVEEIPEPRMLTLTSAVGFVRDGYSQG